MAAIEYNFEEVVVDVCFAVNVPPDNPWEDELGVPYDPPPLPIGVETWDTRDDQTSPGGMPSWWIDPPPPYHWPQLQPNKIIGITISPGLIEKGEWKVFHSDYAVQMTGDLRNYFKKSISFLTTDGESHSQPTSPVDTPLDAKYLYKYKAPDSFIETESITVHYARGDAEDVVIYIHYDSEPPNNALIRVLAKETI